MTTTDLDELTENFNKVTIAESPKSKLEDKFTKKILKKLYTTHLDYYLKQKEIAEKYKIKIRYSCIPESISENIIKFIIHKNGDTTSTWDCKGDLLSEIEGKQECKCFTSDGPLSFTPSSEWGVIYFLDAREWLSDKFVLWRVNLKRTDELWAKIKVNKKSTFFDQTKQGRRPRIGWETLYPQIASHTTKIFEGTFEQIIAEGSEGLVAQSAEPLVQRPHSPPVCTEQSQTSPEESDTNQESPESESTPEE